MNRHAGNSFKAIDRGTLQVNAVVHTGYNPLIVALSIAIAVFTSYTALDLASRVHGAAYGSRWAWIAGAALSMGGGIWAMHFIGMLAFEMGMPARYDFGTTSLSFAIALGFTAAGFALVGREGSKPHAVLIGGPLMGVGVAAMHYTGMAAMRMSGSISYSAPVVVLSVAIAIAAATAALRLSFLQHGVWQKLAAAGVMGIAVAGMHYTGMAAATFTSAVATASMAHASALTSSQLYLAVSVASATFFVLLAAMLMSSWDRYRVQIELGESEERFRAAIQAVRGVLWTNDAEGRMGGEQPGWAAITGQSRAAYEGYGWAAAVHPEDAGPTLQAWAETVREKRMFVFEHRVRSRDGEWRHYAIRAVPILEAAGSVREWVGVHTDITEQREAEAELRETSAEIQRFASIVSHDLRAPLVNVIGFAGELASLQVEVHDALADHPMRTRIDEDFGEALGFIKASVQRMDRLVAAILRLSRDGRRGLHAEPLDMVALLQTLVDAQRHQCAVADACVCVATDLPPITSDRLAVEQVFGNLIDNAVKYLADGRPGRIEISGRQVDGRFACYDVRDNGRGIDIRDQRRVFELFRRVGVQDRPGDGIGLAHAKSLVRALGGRIAMSSEPGTGTTFSVTLPRDAEGHRGYLVPTAVAADRGVRSNWMGRM